MADIPDWEDTPGAYEFTASMTAVVYDNGGAALGDVGDMLAAFDADGNVRGISTMMDGLGSSADLTLHAITIRSNAAGDEISFQYYDASEDVVYSIQDSYTYTFVINDLIGNLFTPDIFNDLLNAINDDLFPLNYALKQNYPNPYNPKTYINYSVAHLSNVTFRIYDIKGQLMLELLHKIHSPGEYETVWNAGHLATGMYLLEMQVHSINEKLLFRDVNKMLYLK